MSALDTSIEAVERMERLVGLGDWAAAAHCFTADVLYRVGAREPVHGVDGIREYMTWQNSLVRWTGHDIRYQGGGEDLVVIEVDSHFHRLADGADIVVPCTDVYRFSGPLIRDWRVYADFSGFFAASGPTAPEAAATGGAATGS